MERNEMKSPKEHIRAIFEDYGASVRMLQTLTNLSNTVIETALSGQYKFLCEILQNTDDAFDDLSKYKAIKLQLVLLDNYFIIQHNGKAFDYNDVERICDYASQIEEVKANDLSKTGYKGLGFKSLFNLSDCIYIYSNGYSFRFDKNHWSEPEKKPWQVIPIWCDTLPLSEKYTYDQSVNFILKINDEKQLNTQLEELIDHPEVLLYLHRINSVYLNQNGTKHILERKIEKVGIFHKIVFFKNQHTVNTWFSRSYERAIPAQLSKCIREASQFIYPDKIKNAKEIDITFTLCTNQTVDNVIKIDGLCYSTLPTQLQLSLPYHINSLFILNLDRTQFHENEWNEFLIYQIGYLQLSFLQDLAEIPNLKNFVIELLVRKINHPYNVFSRAFSKGFEETKTQIAWLPAYKGYLLKLGEACVDKIHFFKQNFQNIRDDQCGYVIDYDVKSQNLLNENEVRFFTYDSLFNQFLHKYYPQLTENSYIKFLSYIYDISQNFPLSSSEKKKLKETPFLKTKNRTLIPPTEALIEDDRNPIPDFAELNTVDKKYLPICKTDSFKKWLVSLGAKRLDSPVKILRESILQWINSYILQYKMNINNHKAIIGYLAENFADFASFTYDETKKLKENLLILTKSNTFRIATKCFLPNAITQEDLGEVMSNDEIISSCYDLPSLKYFFCWLGVSDSLRPIEVFRKCIFVWIKNGQMSSKLTAKNFKPIIEFLSSEYQNIASDLTKEEKELLKEMPVITSNQTVEKVKNCSFDTAIPQIEGFEDVFEKCKLVSTQNLSGIAQKFLSSIGISKTIDPALVIRNSALKWIQHDMVKSKINLNNHFDILKYVAMSWYQLSKCEKETLRKLPVLTKSNILKEACNCFWEFTNVYGFCEEIPKLESVVFTHELVSFDYYTHEKERLTEIKELLDDLGVRHLTFANIYDRYFDHLTDLDIVEWFFSNVIKHWEINSSSADKGPLLKNLKAKLLHSSNLLAKNGKAYPITELYSSDFLDMYNIDENAVPLLAFENLPKDLEEWLGIKQKLDLPCIIKLLGSFDKKETLGEEVTLKFFKTLLEQLQKENETEIRKHPLKLLSNDNKLTLSTDLYYFKEENAVCLAQCYLKRIHGMSHSETLKLAELCGVNLLEFNQEVIYGEEIPTYDKSLREFYLERLPLIVLQESKALNESLHVVLKKLFLKVNSIEIYKCQKIFIKYPFDKPVETRCYFDGLKTYVVGNWKNLRTKIHLHIKQTFELKTDITEILDLEYVAEDKTQWLYYQKGDPQKLLTIEEELNKLRSEQMMP